MSLALSMFLAVARYVCRTLRFDMSANRILQRCTERKEPDSQSRLHLVYPRRQYVSHFTPRLVRANKLATLTEQMEWISKALVNALERAPPSLEIAICIFVTGGRKPDQMPLMNNNDSDFMYSMDGPTPTNADMPMMAPRMLADFPSVQITPGRPDIPKMLKDEVAHASGRLSVTGMSAG